MSKWGMSARRARGNSSKPWSIDKKKDNKSVAQVLTAISFDEEDDHDKFVDITDHTHESTEASHHKEDEIKTTFKVEELLKEEQQDVAALSSKQTVEDEKSAETEATTEEASLETLQSPEGTSPVATAKQKLSENQKKIETKTLDLPSLVPVKKTAKEIEEGKLNKSQLKRDSSVDVSSIEEGTVSTKVEVVETTGKQSLAKTVAQMAVAEANRKKALASKAAASVDVIQDAAAEFSGNEAQELIREAECSKEHVEPDDEVMVAAKVLLSGEYDEDDDTDTQPHHEEEEEEQDDANSTRAEVDFDNSSAPQPSSPDQRPVTSVTAGSPVTSEVTYEKTPSQKLDSSSLGSFSASGSPSSPRKKVSDIIRRDLWDKDPKVVETSMQILADKATNNLSIRNAIARSGGLLAIVRAMESHIDNTNIQIAACQALEKLALDTENELAIGEVGGVEAILGAMMAHFHDTSLQEAAWSALWNCTCGNACDTMTIDTEDGMKAIVSCMKQHMQSPTIQASACGTLSNLCLNNEERLTSLAEAGGFSVISTAMETHWNNESVRNEAAHTLYSLVALNAQRHLASQNIDDEEEIIEELIDEDEDVVS